MSIGSSLAGYGNYVSTETGFDFSSGAQGSSFTPTSAEGGGFWGAVQSGISTIGSLSGLGLNVYGQYQAIKGSTSKNQMSPETTPDQRYVSDIQGPREAVGLSITPLMLFGLVGVGALVFFSMRK